MKKPAELLKHGSGFWESILRLLILQALLLRASIPFVVNPVYFDVTDPIRHFRYATEPLFLSPMAVMDAPLYQIWLTLINKLTVSDAFLLSVHSAVLSLVTPWLWYLFLKEALPQDRRMALIGFAILAWLPSWMGIFSYFMPETILLPLLGLSLWATYRARSNPSDSRLAVASLCWTLAVLGKVVVLPAAIVAGFWMVSGSSGIKWKKALIMIGIGSILLCPAAYLTYRVLNIPSPFGFPEMNRIYFESGKKAIKAHYTKDSGAKQWNYIFQSPSVESEPFYPFSNWTSTRSKTDDVEISVDLDKGLEDWLRESQKNKGDLSLHLRMLSENAIMILFGRSWPDETSRKFLFVPHDWMRFLWAPLAVLVLAGNLWGLGKRRKMELLPTLVTVTLIFFFCLPAAVGEGRYRKPLEGLLVANALWLVMMSRKRKFGYDDDFLLSGGPLLSAQNQETCNQGACSKGN